MGREHRFGLVMGLIELANEIGGKRTVGSGLRIRHSTLPKTFRHLQLGELAATSLRRTQHRLVRKPEIGSDGRRNAENSPPRSRKKRGANLFGFP